MKKYIAIIFISLFLIGCGNKTVDIEGEAVTYDELQDKIKTAETELKDLGENLQTTQQELNDNKEEFEELTKLSEKRGELEKEVTSLDNEIKTKQKELVSVTAEVEKSEKETIEVGAGHFVFGEDVPAGRYEAFPAGQSSKITVKDFSGEVRVNEVIGAEDSPSYVFEALDDYTLELNGAVELVPLK